VGGKEYWILALQAQNNLPNNVRFKKRLKIEGGRIDDRYYKAHYELDFGKEDTIEFRDKVFRLYYAFLEGKMKFFVLKFQLFSFFNNGL